MSENTNAQNEPVEPAVNSAAAADSKQAIDPMVELQNKLKDAEQKYIYLYADFENFKKRSIKERQDTLKFGWENVANDLLAVLDNFDRALQFAKPDSDPNLISGLKMVAQQFKTALEKQGVQTIHTEKQSFNPEFHEAVGQIPSELPQGTVVQEQQKGYTLHGRLLRASRVLVSTGTPAAN